MLKLKPSCIILEQLRINSTKPNSVQFRYCFLKRASVQWQRIWELSVQYIFQENPRSFACELVPNLWTCHVQCYCFNPIYYIDNDDELLKSNSQSVRQIHELNGMHVATESTVSSVLLRLSDFKRSLSLKYLCLFLKISRLQIREISMNNKMCCLRKRWHISNTSGKQFGSHCLVNNKKGWDAFWLTWPRYNATYHTQYIWLQTVE